MDALNSLEAAVCGPGACAVIRASWRFADYRRAWQERGFVGVGARATFGGYVLLLRIGVLVGVQAAGDRLAELRQGTADRVVEVLRLRSLGLCAPDIAKRLDEPLAHVRDVLRLALILEELR